MAAWRSAESIPERPSSMMCESVSGGVGTEIHHRVHEFLPALPSHGPGLVAVTKRY